MSDYATKQDVQEIVNKAVEDLSDVMKSFMVQVDERFNKVESGIFLLQSDMQELKTEQLESRRLINKLIDTLDGYAGAITDNKIEQAARDN